MSKEKKIKMIDVKNIGKKDIMLGTERFIRKGKSGKVTEEEYKVIKSLYGEDVISVADAEEAEKKLKEEREKSETEILSLMKKLEDAEKKVKEFEEENKKLSERVAELEKEAKKNK